VKWKIKDHQGKTHTILLPGTYYAPTGKYKLLCPQHWAQTANDHYPKPNGTWCGTYSDRIVLHWSQQKYQKTVKLVPKTNIGIMYTAPSIKKYAQACQLYEKNIPMLCMSTTVELQEESEGETKRTHIIAPASSRESSQERTIVHEGENGVDDEEAAADNPPNINHKFDLDGTKGDAIEEVQHPELMDSQQELLHWHYRLNHLSSIRIQMMAKMHLLPARLAKCSIPSAVDVYLGKPTRNHGRQKARNEILRQLQSRGNASQSIN